jgi:cytochrome c oxidase subunit II
MHAFFHPQSPQARLVTTLWWWMFSVGGTVWLLVIVSMLYSLRARRGERGDDDLLHVSESTHHGMERTVIGAGIVTVVILLAFLAYDYSVGEALAQHPNRALTIDLVGHQWWWEATYEDPDQSKQVTTANEIHVPVGEPVQFKLRSADVIHSFWVPSLNGKRDLIPGYVSSQWFTADTAGTYRGQCAEFCGLQHAKMALYIIAEPRPKFAAWLAAGSTNPTPPTDSTLRFGQQVFMSASCAVCHSIGGTQAMATLGPNLTHLKSRRTIAAGTLANNVSNLTGWIVDPQAFKPGTLMPKSTLKPAELQALVAYLETLK